MTVPQSHRARHSPSDQVNFKPATTNHTDVFGTRNDLGAMFHVILPSGDFLCHAVPDDAPERLPSVCHFCGWCRLGVGLVRREVCATLALGNIVSKHAALHLQLRFSSPT